MFFNCALQHGPLWSIPGNHHAHMWPARTDSGYYKRKKICAFAHHKTEDEKEEQRLKQPDREARM